MKNEDTDYINHRRIISYSLKGEPSKIKAIFDQVVREKIAGHMEVRRAEIGANLFGKFGVQKESIDESFYTVVIDNNL